jgi:hypothetical protein
MEDQESILQTRMSFIRTSPPKPDLLSLHQDPPESEASSSRHSLESKELSNSKNFPPLSKSEPATIPSNTTSSHHGHQTIRQPLKLSDQPTLPSPRMNLKYDDHHHGSTAVEEILDLLNHLKGLVSQVNGTIMQIMKLSDKVTVPSQVINSENDYDENGSCAVVVQDLIDLLKLFKTQFQVKNDISNGSDTSSLTQDTLGYDFFDFENLTPWIKPEPIISPAELTNSQNSENPGRQPPNSAQETLNHQPIDSAKKTVNHQPINSAQKLPVTTPRTETENSHQRIHFNSHDLERTNTSQIGQETANPLINSAQEIPVAVNRINYGNYTQEGEIGCFVLENKNKKMVSNSRRSCLINPNLRQTKIKPIVKNSDQKEETKESDRSRYFLRCRAVFDSKEEYDDFRKNDFVFNRLKYKIQFGFDPQGKIIALLEFAKRSYAQQIEDEVKKEYGYAVDKKYLISTDRRWDKLIDSGDYPYAENDYGVDKNGNRKVIAFPIHKLRMNTGTADKKSGHQRPAKEDIEGTLKRSKIQI